MSLLSPFLLIGILFISASSSSPSEDVEQVVVVNDFEVDYETALSLAGLAIECHDQVGSCTENG